MKLYLTIILIFYSLNIYATTKVGYIEDFGDINHIEWNKNTTYYAPVYIGDTITVKEDGFININQCNQVYKITNENSPYTVQKTGCDVIKITDNIWLAIKTFAKYVTTILDAPPIEARTKSPEDPPTIQMLESIPFTTPTLKAGKRNLFLKWSGGKAPYQLKIINTKQKNTLWETKIELNFAKTNKINLQAGEYQLIIQASNRTQKYDFEVVERIDYSEELQDLPENLRTTLQAAWLVSRDKTNRIKWSFEAYQQLSKFKEYGPARELRKALEQERNF